MKRLAYILFVVFYLSACDSVLDIEPETATTYTNYFKGEKDAAALLYQLNGDLFFSFSGARNHQVIGLKADEVNDSDCRNMRNLVFDPHLSAGWRALYRIIYQANLILDNAYRFTDIDPERLEYYKCQACFAKGFAYFQLARMWGDAPIVPNSTDTKPLPRENVMKVLQEAARNAEIALALPVFEDLTDENGAKVMSKQYGSKGAATALLAHIYAWKAGLSGEEEDWKKAEYYCSDLIEGEAGYYQLAENPQEMCEKVMKGNSVEGIFEGEYYMPDDPYFQYRPYEATSLFLTYPVIEGELPTDESTFEIYKTTVKEMYGEGDRRLDAYFFKIDSMYRNPAGEEIPVKKAFLYKWNYPVYRYNQWSMKNEYKTQDVNTIVWRLADIMLLRAECRARLGMGNAVEDLNAVRRRAYGNGEHDYKVSEGDLRYIIFKEREKELLFEGHRYYDVMRNGYWKTELTEVFANMSEEEFKMGAQYYPVFSNSFYHNDLMIQNEYWQSKGVK